MPPLTPMDTEYRVLQPGERKRGVANEDPSDGNVRVKVKLETDTPMAQVTESEGIGGPGASLGGIRAVKTETLCMEEEPNLEDIPAHNPQWWKDGFVPENIEEEGVGKDQEVEETRRQKPERGCEPEIPTPEPVVGISDGSDSGSEWGE